ncbi:flagellar basal-body MS-ring/collar protein FliF [Amaricoccus sp.]|uniref:flagellar basal-body MS-ring/collar protein FliF n=1 Tax=Amaricoccus sp. TaxID=1872485 RepID=UPI001B554B69|nr:flagellar basal-body MS-ring/collar protein FliF [Amaricoccus sp.]MBP7243371.1 flagellar M-ring protein FliF [Amaricoccus sp.]
MQNLKSLWETLQPRQRLIAALSVVAMLAAIYGIARVASAPSMELLYSGLDAAAAGEVVAAVEALDVPYEVRDTAIFVDGARRDEIRLALATQGLPAAGPAGYELLDGLSGFGTTSQMFDAAYWRAKEGELARTIAAAPNVRAARVHLANPVAAPFARTPTGSASVTVTMARGGLDQGQARAIRYLVSSAVAGLGLDAVAVIDAAAGVVLAGAESGPFPPGVSDPADRSETLRANVQRLLEARVGSGRAIVEVNVDAAMDSETIRERRLDPEGRVAISTDVETSQESAQGGASGVTVASNLPDGDVAGSGDQSSRNSTQNRERQNFEVSETTRERVILPGQVRRVSVAVMVDGVTTAGADGKPQWAPRSPEELDVLRMLVQSAVGFDAERGDVVTIQTLQFAALSDQGSLVENAGSGWLAANGAGLAQMGVLGAIVLALILFVLRPMMAGRSPAAAIAELTGPRELPAETLRALGGPAALPPPAGGEFLDMPPATLTKIDRLRDVIASRGEESAAVLRAWIESPEPRKEAPQP